uniref:Protein kinase domain-containing protein n=1 Tax=Oryza barthii TaxID=65489 RepID=A0A0D3GCX3_9ORYZ
MAVWGGLGQAATVAQLVGADVGGLISSIIQAAATARQNKRECDQLARRVVMIADLLPHLQDAEVMRRPEVRRPLVELGDTLLEAHELVASCQGRSAAYRFVMAGRLADRFRDVQSKIDSYLIVFPFIAHIDITRRLDQIYRILAPNDTAAASSSSSAGSSQSDQIYNILVSNDATAASSPSSAGSLQSPDVLEFARISQGDGGEEFTVKELVAATNNFANEIGRGSCGSVYKGRLRDGREVAIKSLVKTSPDHGREESLMRELAILSRLRHDHIVRLLGFCVVREKKRESTLLLSFRKKKKKAAERQAGELLLVYDYMENGSLADQLHGHLSSSSSSSPVMASWKMRIKMLLGVSRGIQYLHHGATTTAIIHGDIKLSNILVDSSWVPHLTDFGAAVINGMERPSTVVHGTAGYIDPELYSTMNQTRSSDVYSFGVVMLEMLTGKRPTFIDRKEEGEVTNLVAFSLPIIEDGELGRLLDRRPAEPKARQLEALEMVARTAARCVQLQRKERPAISEVVAILETALDLLLRDG